MKESFRLSHGEVKAKYQSIEDEQAYDEVIRDEDASNATGYDGASVGFENSNEHLRLHRKEFRLEGIEVYAVVGDLNLASSIACLDAYNDIEKDRDVYIIVLHTSLLLVLFLVFTQLSYFQWSQCMQEQPSV